jgi:Raf kinase inhibitor-like YbhB/YbcL family protein
MADLSFRTKAFTYGESIPEKYTCEGEDVSPELVVGDVPDDVHRSSSDAAHQNPSDSEDAAALAVVMDDPDAPGGTFTHWLLWNLPPDTITIPEAVPQLAEVPDLDGARQGENDFGDVGYRGPCPPEGDDSHEYRFTIYLLDEELDVDAGARRPSVQDALDDQTLDSAQFTGTFSRF